MNKHPVRKIISDMARSPIAMRFAITFASAQVFQAGGERTLTISSEDAPVAVREAIATLWQSFAAPN